jgi:hypothetical protein
MQLSPDRKSLWVLYQEPTALVEFPLDTLRAAGGFAFLSCRTPSTSAATARGYRQPAGSLDRDRIT